MTQTQPLEQLVPTAIDAVLHLRDVYERVELPANTDSANTHQEGV